jgi:hypothetical protein
VNEYLDRLIESLECDAQQGRADMRRQLATNKANRHLVGHVNRIAQRLETLKRLAHVLRNASSASNRHAGLDTTTEPLPRS